MAPQWFALPDSRWWNQIRSSLLILTQPDWCTVAWPTIWAWMFQILRSAFWLPVESTQQKKTGKVWFLIQVTSIRHSTSPPKTAYFCTSIFRYEGSCIVWKENYRFVIFVCIWSGWLHFLRSHLPTNSMNGEDFSGTDLKVFLMKTCSPGSEITCTKIRDILLAWVWNYLHNHAALGIYLNDYS